MKSLILTIALSLPLTAMASVDQGAEDMINQLKVPGCQQTASLMFEAAQYRDEGYSQHRVARHAMSFLGYNPPQDAVWYIHMMVNDMFQNPDVTAEEYSDKAFSDCMGG